MRRYNWHSAGSLSWSFSMLNINIFFQIKSTEGILSNSSQKLLRFAITKILIAVSGKFICVIYYHFVSFAIIFGTLSFHVAGSRGTGAGWAARRSPARPRTWSLSTTSSSRTQDAMWLSLTWTATRHSRRSADDCGHRLAPQTILTIMDYIFPKQNQHMALTILVSWFWGKSLILLLPDVIF